MHTANIIFFYPSKIVGGAEFLFARLAKYLQEFCNKNVYYIDYSDGFIRTNPEFKDLNYIDYNDKVKSLININCTIISPISNIYRIHDYIEFENKNIHLLFWTLHTYNLIHVMPEALILEKFSAKENRFILKKFCKNSFKTFNYMLNECNKTDSIYFMDCTTYNYNKTIFSDSLEKKYLPIASKEKNIYSNGKIINDTEINIAILGRLCEEKTISLLNVIENLDKVKTSLHKCVHIIGNGECKNMINPKRFNNTEIIFKGTLTGNELDNYLVNNTDILFSMGTSCLEGAALKIPVVTIPYSYNRFKLNKFHFLFDSKEYTVGTSLKEYKQIAKLTFDDIINIIYRQNKKKQVGEECYEYFYKNHSLENTANLLLNYINKNKLSAVQYLKIKQNAGQLKTNRNFIFNKLIKKAVRYAKK